MPAPAPAPTVRGRFLWYELLTTDVDRAKEFYTKALGWGTQPWGQSAMGTPYEMWMNGANPIGGIMPLPEEARAAGAPPHWSGYIGTPDLDATLTRARDLKASVKFGPTDIPTVGRFAVLADPQGAMFDAYTPSNEPPAEEDPKVGEVSWHELATTDYEAAFSFYQNLFGWEKMESMDMGPLGVYLMFGRGGRMYGGIYNKPADMPFPPHWLFYVRVNDVNTSIPGIKDAGGQILNGPMEVPGGDLIANCLDPQGAAFAIHSKKA